MTSDDVWKIVAALAFFVASGGVLLVAAEIGEKHRRKDPK